MQPLAAAATALPSLALRADPAAAVTAFARYLPQLLKVRRRVFFGLGLGFTLSF